MDKMKDKGARITDKLKRKYNAKGERRQGGREEGEGQGEEQWTR